MLEEEFCLTDIWLTTLSVREHLEWGCPQCRTGHPPKAPRRGGAGDKDRTLPLTNVHQASQGEQSGPSLTGPRSGLGLGLSIGLLGA